MSNTGTKVALGAAATAAVFGAKELAHIAPQVAHVAPQVVSHSAPLVEIAAGKGALLVNGSGSGLTGGSKTLRSSGEIPTSATSSRLDSSSPLGTTMKLGKIADSKTNPNQQFDMFAPRETGRIDEVTGLQVSPPRSAVVLNSGDSNGSGKISSYLSATNQD